MWSRAPLFRLAVAFFFGQYLHPVLPDFEGAWLILGFLLFLPLSHSYMHSIWSYHRRHIGGMMIFVALVALGYFCAEVCRNEPQTPFEKRSAVLTALQITDGPSARSSSVRYKASIVDMGASNHEQFLGRTIWLYVKDDSSTTLQIGDIICVEKSPQPIHPPANPGEFNFKEYSSGLGITGTAYVKPDEMILIQRSNHTPIFDSVRNQMLAKLDASSIEHDQLGIIKALTFGYKDDLEADQREDFAKAGAMHVLAVSGLHVGLIYIVLNTILRVPPGFRKLRVTKSLVVIAVIWFYAGITGFSPSVLRSATMFTFLVAGDLLGRKLCTLNSIAASSFFLVCLEPSIIHQLGFKLSYLAVCGIVIFHPFLASLITTRFKAIRWIWDLTCVSICAQLFTLPLTLFYFGHFPVYGLLANIVIIPLATGLLYSSLLYTALPSIKWLSLLLEKLADYFSFFMLETTDFIANLDGSQVEYRLNDAVEMLLFLSLIIALVVFLLTAKKGWLMYFLLGLCSFISWPFVVHLAEDDETALCVHSFPNSTCISVFGIEQGLLFTHEKAHQDSVNMDRKIKCTWQELGVCWNKRQAQILENKMTQINFGENGKIRIETGGIMPVNGISEAHAWIPHCDWNEQYTKVMREGDYFILDLSLDYRQYGKWKNALERLQLAFWDVREQGALVLTRTDIAAASGKYRRTFPTSSN